MSLIFDKSEILSMNLHKTPNKVLVKPSRGSNEVVLSGGMKIYMDDRFGKEKHAPTTGEIVAHCGPLAASRMPWETKNEIQVGDYAVFSYESAMHAMDEVHGRILLDKDNQPYFLIDYEDLFVVKRGVAVIPVNGYLLVSPIAETSNANFDIIRENENSTTFGTVEYIGSRNLRYLFGGITRTDIFDFEEQISPGDVIVFNQSSDIPVEYPLHKSLSGLSSKTFFRLQRRDIDAIIPASEKNKYGF